MSENWDKALRRTTARREGKMGHRVIYHEAKSDYIEAQKSLSGTLEALLFAAGDPLSIEELAQYADTDTDAVRLGLKQLGQELKNGKRGVELRRLEERYTLSTQALYIDALRRFFEQRKSAKLSNAAYEVLAVVAYNQPVTRAQIDQVRGVNSDGPLNRLLEHGLIEESGRLDLPGRPAQFSTTDAFLKLTGLESQHDLPPEELLMYDSLQVLEQILRELEGEARKDEPFDA